MAGETKLSISGMPIRQPRQFTREEFATSTPDPEDGPDCIEILPDGRHVEWHGPDTWYEVDPVTNELMNLDRPLDPESIPASLRDNQPLD